MIAPAIKIEDDVDLSRSYVEGEEVDFDEDVTHEFKGHRNLGYEEMPNFVKYDNSGRPTRQPLSKAICRYCFVFSMCKKCVHYNFFSGIFGDIPLILLLGNVYEISCLISLTEDGCLQFL